MSHKFSLNKIILKGQMETKKMLDISMLSSVTATFTTRSCYVQLNFWQIQISWNLIALKLYSKTSFILWNVNFQDCKE